MRTTHLSLLGLSLLVGAGSMLPQRAQAFSSGVFLTNFGLDIRFAPACGACHADFSPGAMGLEVSLTPGQRSLDVGQTIPITTSATGGLPHPMDFGGFAAEVTDGQFTPVAMISQVNGTGRAITHINGRTDQNRTWNYDFTAPATPGLVELRTVVNTVNGDFTSDGDVFGFHGPDQSVNTPVRLFVNAQGVTSLGQSCEGGFGNYPVLGAPTPSQIGNTGFSLEVHGVPGGAPVFFFFGLDPNPTPLSLGGLAPGCELLTPLDPPNPLFMVTASAGSVPRAEGIATLALPIPAVAGINPGDQFVVQGVVLDFNTPGVLPISATNGLIVTLF